MDNKVGPFNRRYVLSRFDESDDSGLFVFQISADNHICIPYASRGFLEIFEVSQDVISADAKSVFERIHPMDLERVRGSIDWAIRHLKPWQTDWRIETSAGALRRITASAKFELDATGNVIAFGHICDVTEVHEFEFGAELDETLLRTAVAALGDGISDWNPINDEVYYSSGWKRMLGYSDNEIENSLEEWSSRVHADDRAACFAALEDHLEGRTATYSSEHRVRCKDGSYKWVLDRGLVMSRLPNNKAVRVIGMHTDITAQRQAEEVLRLQSRIIERAPIRIMTLDPTNDGFPVIHINEAFGTITGYQSKEVVSQPCRYLGANNQIDPSQDVLRRAVMNGQDAEVVFNDLRRGTAHAFGTSLSHNRYMTPMARSYNLFFSVKT